MPDNIAINNIIKFFYEETNFKSTDSAFKDFVNAKQNKKNWDIISSSFKLANAYLSDLTTKTFKIGDKQIVAALNVFGLAAVKKESRASTPAISVSDFFKRIYEILQKKDALKFSKDEIDYTISKNKEVLYLTIKEQDKKLVQYGLLTTFEGFNWDLNLENYVSITYKNEKNEITTDLELTKEQLEHLKRAVAILHGELNLEAFKSSDVGVGSYLVTEEKGKHAVYLKVDDNKTTQFDLKIEEKMYFLTSNSSKNTYRANSIEDALRLAINNKEEGINENIAAKLKQYT